MADTQSGPLLYISNAATNEVRVYSWPALSHVGTLTGFNTPFGECVDASGNVWVTNLNGERLDKYAHGGAAPIKTLSLASGFPHDCSVNPKNGDLAVTSDKFQIGLPGGIAVYSANGTEPTIYHDPAIPRMFFLAYDANGNLFVDGKDSSGAFQMAKFKNKTFTPITLSGGAKVKVPGGIFAQGTALSVGDLSKSHAVIYQITETGTVTGTTDVDSTVCAQYFITTVSSQQTLICPNFQGPSVDIYDYPAGGKPTKHLKKGLDFPFGSAISP